MTRNPHMPTGRRGEAPRQRRRRPTSRGGADLPRCIRALQRGRPGVGAVAGRAGSGPRPARARRVHDAAGTNPGSSQGPLRRVHWPGTDRPVGFAPVVRPSSPPGANRRGGGSTCSAGKAGPGAHAETSSEPAHHVGRDESPPRPVQTDGEVTARLPQGRRAGAVAPAPHQPELARPDGQTKQRTRGRRRGAGLRLAFAVAFGCQGDGLARTRGGRSVARVR